MSKISIAASILQCALLFLLVGSILGFLSFLNIYGVFLASITAFIAWGTYKNRRWGYFSAAAWGLACYQLAKQGYEFQKIKHVVMTVGILVIPTALFLHEILGLHEIIGRQKNKNAQKSVTKEAIDDDLPQ